LLNRLSTGTYEHPVDFDNAGITGPYRTHQGGVVADMRDLSVTKYGFNEKFAGWYVDRRPVNHNLN
jgi:hypothetical protein